ncbi:MAG: cation transporter [Nitrospina sp.]|jgi:cation diffusion facilitator family transporter|nr:cation transporter [Nitrospina sp.]MBT6718688.1 cation transporter [Nitrospina sp.]
MMPGTKAILVGAAANLLLSCIKFIGGILGNSMALVADAFHSLSDLLTDVVVYFSHGFGQLPPDQDHPYGHGRAETIGTTIVGLLIIFAGLGVAYESWEAMSSIIEKTPGWIAASTACFSILVNEGLYHYTLKIGNATKSPSLVANAWHHRTDAISSIAALVGVIGAWNGISIMDPLAGALVGLMVCKVGYDFTREGFRDLMDTALSEEHTKKVFAILNEIPEVLHFHDLRSRTIGGEILMDVHILVNPEMTVTEGHQIAEVVRRNIIKEFGNVQDVLVHVDGEHDAEVENLYNTTRRDITEIINPIIEGLERVRSNPEIRTHHINGKITVDIFLQMNEIQTVEEAQRLINKVKIQLEATSKIDRARVFLDLNFEFKKPT